MPFNRELLASMSFEPLGVSDDDDDDDLTEKSVRKQKSKIGTAADGAADAGQLEDDDGDDTTQNEATKRVIRCLKLALTESIIGISHPQKQRQLNPKVDFSIQATTEFAAEKKSTSVSCCGGGAKVKRSHGRGEHPAKHSQGHRRRHVQQNEFGLPYMTHEDTNFPQTQTSTSKRGGRGYFDIMVGDEGGSAMPRRRQNSLRLDAATLSEDDEEEEEEESAQVDFKFTDYSPMCYRHIREFFGVDPKQYCDVLRYSRWHSIPTPGKSAAQLFFCGRNWVIKTMTDEESVFLRDILHRYYYHVRDNPYTLLPHFVGHHRLQIGTSIQNFIIMQNVFATTNTIHEKFDLKGSTIGRFASDAEKLRATCTQKDLDVHRPLHVGPERRQLLIDQVKADCDFLKQSRIMDYSFLVGVHILPPSYSPPSLSPNAAQASVTPGSTTVFNAALDSGALTSRSAFVSAMTNALQRPQHPGLQRADGMRENAGGAGFGAANPHGPSLSPLTPCDGRCFTSDEGGMLSNDVPGLRREIYYIGIIDILQQYNVRKNFETFFVGLANDYHRISCVNPKDYAARFISFMTSIIV